MPLTIAQAESLGFSASRLARVSEMLRAYVDRGVFPGVSAIVARRGQVVLAESYGLRDIAAAQPMTLDTILRIYSMTKPIASVALMTLYEQGYFQLNDPVSRYVPSWKNHRVWVSGEGSDMVTEAPKRPVSFRDVLCHTAGLTYEAQEKVVSAVAEDVDRVLSGLPALRFVNFGVPKK